MSTRELQQVETVEILIGWMLCGADFPEDFQLPDGRIVRGCPYEGEDEPNMTIRTEIIPCRPDQVEQMLESERQKPLPAKLKELTERLLTTSQSFIIRHIEYPSGHPDTPNTFCVQWTLL